jgi:hypothetical protein
VDGRRDDKREYDSEQRKNERDTLLRNRGTIEIVFFVGNNNDLSNDSCCVVSVVCSHFTSLLIGSKTSDSSCDLVDVSMFRSIKEEQTSRVMLV